jgi:hypothetical protein
MTSTEAEDIARLQILKDTDTFPLWDFEIKILLKAREVMDVVDGTDLTEKGRDEEKIKNGRQKMRRHNFI